MAPGLGKWAQIALVHGNPDYKHGPTCAGCWCKPCLAFSTDGTVMGARIAHTMGTMNEDEIKGLGFQDPNDALTGMDEEQADWESTE